MDSSPVEFLLVPISEVYQHELVVLTCMFSFSVYPVLQRRGHHAGGHQRWLDDVGHRGDALLERSHAEDQDPGGDLYCQQVHGHAEVSKLKVRSSYVH